MDSDDQDLGPDPAPKGDFIAWIQPEILGKNGFAARAYWVFGSKLNPKLVLRVKLNGMMFRISLKPRSKESWPHKSLVERHLLTEAARSAVDYGAPAGIEGGLNAEDFSGPRGHAEDEGDAE